jgi:hypothetical protein
MRTAVAGCGAQTAHEHAVAVWSSDVNLDVTWREGAARMTPGTMVFMIGLQREREEQQQESKSHRFL